MHYNANNRDTSFNMLPEYVTHKTKARMHLHPHEQTRPGLPGRFVL